jgi:hypothetical protein
MSTPYEAQLADLKNKFEDSKANTYRLEGAIQVLTHIIALEKAGAEVAPVVKKRK